MTTLRAELAAQLARYDDDTFAALANRGLLRRATKDLEKQAATVVEDGADALVMAFGEHRIRFDARGPAQARCSCPANGVCQHILAAALTLQRDAQAAPSTTAAPAEEAAPAASPPADATPVAAPADPLAALHASLAAIAASDLQRHAGKAGYRWAWQFVQDLDAENDLRVSGERNLVLAFAHPRVGFRYMGGGLDALIADADVAQAAKYRVAALLAYRRQRGLDVVAPEPTAKDKAATAALDLGMDHQLATGGELRDSRARMRGAALQLLGECIDLGLSHLSRGIHERFATLAVWAQGAELPRLSLLLRRVADHVELLLERAGGADEHRLLDELTLAFGLASALDDAATRGTAPAHLVGRARTRYEGAGALELLGLGANAWRSAAGYVGMTMLFWSPGDDSFMSCTDARPESLRGFDPIARYRAAGPWGGLGAPAQATGRRVRLTGAQLNHQGRLSAAEATSAIVMPPGDLAAFRAAIPATVSWTELAGTLGAARRSLLSEPRPMKDWAVLEPTRFDAPRFDEARQALVWPLHDLEGRTLHAELAWTPQTRHAIARLEQLREADLAPGTRVVARVLPGAAPAPSAAGETGTAPAVLVAEPLSLIRADSGASPIDALFFDPPPTGVDLAMAPRRAAAPSATSTVDASAPDTSSTALPRALRELRHWMRTQAERGVGEGRAAQLAAALSERAARCGDAGFSALAAAPQAGRDAPPSHVLLRMNYLCLQFERLIAGVAVEAA